MKKILPVILILVLFTVYYCSNETGKINQQNAGSAGVQFAALSIPDALAKAKAENKIVLVDFFSPT
jgi:thiol:disulfide interchange protein